MTINTQANFKKDSFHISNNLGPASFHKLACIFNTNGKGGNE